MLPQQPTTERGAQSTGEQDDERAVETTDSHEMPCPVCGTPMPDLKGGKASICPVCGFKDSCCY